MSRAAIKHNSFCQLILPSLSTLRAVLTEKRLSLLALNKESRAKCTDINQEMIMVNETVDLRLKLTCLVNLARPISLINEELRIWYRFLCRFVLYCSLRRIFRLTFKV